MPAELELTVINTYKRLLKYCVPFNGFLGTECSSTLEMFYLLSFFFFATCGENLQRFEDCFPYGDKLIV